MKLRISSAPPQLTEVPSGAVVGWDAVRPPR
jgi:hypothetical protein